MQEDTLDFPVSSTAAWYAFVEINGAVWWGIDHGLTTSSFGLWDRNKTFKQFPINRMLAFIEDQI